MLDTNRQLRLKLFSSRYVTEQEAAQFEQSTFRKLYSMDDVSDEQIAKQNAELHAHIQAAHAVVDDDALDDITGLSGGLTLAQQRAKHKAEMEAKRQADAAERQRKNTAMKARLSKVQAVVDTDVSDDLVMFDGVQMTETQARRSLFDKKQAMRDAAEQERLDRNKETKTRMSKIQARTDDDIGDEAAGAQRVAKAKQSKDRKKSEAAALAAKNKQQAVRIEGAKAAVDDDVLDDAVAGGGTVGDLRSQLVDESALKKQVEQQRLAAANAEERERIANVQSRTDDDISDDAAGMARKGYDIHFRDWGEQLEESGK